MTYKKKKKKMTKIDLLNFSIVLDRSDAIFGLGDYVSGICLISLNEQFNFNQLEIKLFGSAETRWEESRSTGTGDDSRTETVTYSGSHHYINVNYLPATGERPLLSHKHILNIPDKSFETNFFNNINFLYGINSSDN